jgi:hypothetical protein
MPNIQPKLMSLLHALAVLIYVVLVALLMNNGEKLFGNMTGLFGPVAFLLLFTVSAAVTGLLVLGRPVYLFLSGSRKEALQFLFYTLGWLVIITLVVFSGLILTK